MSQLCFPHYTHSVVFNDAVFKLKVGLIKSQLDAANTYEYARCVLFAGKIFASFSTSANAHTNKSFTYLRKVCASHFSSSSFWCGLSTGTEIAFQLWIMWADLQLWTNSFRIKLTTCAFVYCIDYSEVPMLDLVELLKINILRSGPGANKE